VRAYYGVPAAQIALAERESAMIWESHFWKDDLLAVAARMRKRCTQRLWPERSLMNVEKDVFIGFYIVRKLIEAKKLSTSTAKHQLTVSVFSSTDKDVTLINRHKIEDLYDLSSPTASTLSLLSVCNQIIHSYVFLTDHSDEGGLAGVYFCSERKRRECLYHLSLKLLVGAFELVGNDYPNEIRMIANDAIRDYRVFARMRPEGKE
jgi:hypothetical protein